MNKHSCRGLSLVEIMLSMGILVVIMLPVFMTFSSGNRSMQVTESEFRTHTAALELMEQLISLPFGLIKAGSYKAGQIVDGQPFANSPVLFRLSQNPDLQPELNISEIKRPEMDAVIVAGAIARQIEGRISYRRAIKTSIASTMRIGAEGIKVLISGRLAGAEMARRELIKEGRIPLHTLRADIDYAIAEAHTTYGRIGIKVWICKGELYGKVELTPHVESTAAGNTRDKSMPARPNSRPQQRGGNRSRGPRK